MVILARWLNRWAAVIFHACLMGNNFRPVRQGNGNIRDAFAVAGATQAGAGELLFDLGGGLAEADAADAIGLNQTFSGSRGRQDSDEEGGEDGFHG